MPAIVNGARNGHHETIERIYWTEDEFSALADEWIRLRILNPTEGATDLMDRAQQKVFAAKPERIRKKQSIFMMKPLMAFIQKRWPLVIGKATATPEPPAIPVQIIQIVEKSKMTFDEMLNELDEPALHQLLAAKRIQRENLHDTILRELAAKAGAVALPPVVPFVPKAVFEPPKEKAKRVLIMGPVESLWPEIRKQIEETGLKIDLRFIDADTRRVAVPMCDFVITTRHVSHSAENAAIAAAGKVYFVPTGGVGSIVQKVRDLCSRQDKTPMGGGVIEHE